MEIELFCIWWTTCSWSAVLLDHPCCRRDCNPALTIRNGRSLHEENAMLNLIIEALERNHGLLSPPLAERDRWKVVNFLGDAFDPLCSHSSGEQSSVCFDVTMKCDLMAPCQDAGEGFGFQEESEAVALLNCESTSYACCCEFGVPCDCSQGITAAGQCSQTSSVAMWTRFASEANHPWTF